MSFLHKAILIKNHNIAVEKLKFTIHDVMQKVVSGMYAIGACNKGFTHGSVTIRNGELRLPVIGTLDAEFRYTCLDRYYPGIKDFWVVMYDGLWVFIFAPNIPENLERMYLATVARQCIEKDLVNNKVLFENI